MYEIASIGFYPDDEDSVAEFGCNLENIVMKDISWKKLHNFIMNNPSIKSKL